ncbi:MAG: DNA primase, partial [Deltaproteobacteria bacterium]|nr:DNA primase [Deltaproteobacteria bacterium]
MKYRNIEDRLPAEAVAAGRAAFPENPAEARALTDLGNAERLIDRFGTVLRYCPPRGCWYVWDGSCWNEDKTGEVVRLAKQSVRAIADEAERADPERQKAILKHARQSEQAARLEAAIKLATTERGIPVMPDELDADPWALNVANGTIDLRTGKLRPHCPKDLLTKICPVAYDPSARSAVWDAFLKAATKGDKELEAYLQRMTGRALQGEVVEKAFWFFYGPPDGMKSTFINAISKTLGSYAAPAAFTTWLVQTHIGGNRGDLVALRGARLVTSVEVRRDARFDEATLKAVTGGDALKAAAKYEKEIELRPTFALWLAGNDAPRIRDDDAGAWSRVRRVPFCNPLPAEQRDPSMGEKLAAPE